MTFPCGTLALQTFAMPADTSANGDIFGGWLMAQTDLASSVMARGRPQSTTRNVRLILPPPDTSVDPPKRIRSMP